VSDTNDTNDTAPESANEPARPMLRIVRGEPTPEELAVVTAIVTAAASAGGAAEPELPARGQWSDPAHQHRRSWLHGRGAWRAATR
jgi:Acyl-CoA carboxylase epsilon subunit